MAKAQSAMEYLTTYGWAIVIIVIVLSALYSIGLFNPPVGQGRPGACQVYRPYGPWTQQLITLQGVCNNLEPQSVVHLNGVSGYISINGSLSPQAGSSGLITLCIWYNYLSAPSSFLVYKGAGAPSNGQYVEYGVNWAGGNGFKVYSSTATIIASYVGPVPTTGVWNFECFTYNAATDTSYFYINGVQGANDVVSGVSTAGYGNVIIGGSSGLYSNAYVSNLQMYNTSLSANSIRALYIEGIGGSPVNLQNLVGWWPLNGDTVDYSGNGQNGAPSNTGVSFTSSWNSGYATP